MTQHDYELTATHAVKQLGAAQDLIRVSKDVAASLVTGGEPGAEETLAQQWEILKSGLLIAKAHLNLALACVPGEGPDAPDLSAQLLALARGVG